MYRHFVVLPVAAAATVALTVTPADAYDQKYKNVKLLSFKMFKFKLSITITEA